MSNNWFKEYRERDKKIIINNFIIIINFIIVSFIISIYYRILKQEKIYYSIEIGILWIILIHGCLWNIITYFFLEKRILKRNLMIISFLLIFGSFLFGFLLEYYWMYENIKLE